MLQSGRSRGGWPTPCRRRTSWSVSEFGHPKRSVHRADAVDHRARVSDRAVTDRYSALRREHPRLVKEDALIAATALEKRPPLVTGNWRHFHGIAGLKLLVGR